MTRRLHLVPLLALGSLILFASPLAVSPLSASAASAGNASGEAPTAAEKPGSSEAQAHAYIAQDPPDWQAAREAFEEAAEAGSPTAMSYLGWIYEEGHGVAADGEQAAKWYGRAAEAGAHDFAIKLGWMYLGGQGVEQDREQAEYWFEKGVAAEYSPARIAWASVLIADALGGLRTERVHEARELLVVALEDGHVIASFFLARLYIEGIGGHPVDEDLALRYTRIGAEAGHAQMQGWLAFMYLYGDGLAEDAVLAAKWANLAAAGGDASGNELRVALERELSAEEVRRARQLAVDWAVAQR